MLRAFPEDVPLHLGRYDALEEGQRYAEAFAVLQLVMPIATDNVYLLARLVKSECRERRFVEAQEHALLVCFAKMEQSDWPANQDWEQLRGNGLAGELADKFKAKLQAGERPTPHSVVLYAEHLLAGNELSKVPAWLKMSRLNAVTRKVMKLQQLVEESPWSDADYLADLMTLLNKHRYWKLVVASWKRMSQKGLGRSTAMWAQAGNAMINLGKKREAKALMGDWRERVGVQMWMVCNYLMTLSQFKRTDMTELAASTETAIAGLPHDHSARYMVYLEAEARALIGDELGLLAAWERYSYYVEGASEKSDFFPESKKYLIGDLARAVEYLKTDPRRYRRSVWMLRFHRVWTDANRRKLRTALILILRLAILIGLMASSIAPLFR